jgi:hypothetical protein
MRHRRSLSATMALLSAFLGLPVPYARGQSEPIASRTIVASHDYDSATPTACVHGQWITGVGSVSSSGTTVDANTTTAFTNVLAGAEIRFDRGVTGSTSGYVNAVTDGDTLVVNDAPTAPAGSSWSYRNIACGTGAGNGWFGINDINLERTWQLQVDQIALASGSLAVVLQCKQDSFWSTPSQVYPETGGSGQCATGLFTTTASCLIVDNGLKGGMCRWLITLTDDASDVAAAREKVTISVMGTK